MTLLEKCRDTAQAVIMFIHSKCAALQKLRGTSYVHEEISELKELALSKSKKSKVNLFLHIS